MMTKHSFFSALGGTAFCVLWVAASALAQPGGGGPMPGDPTPVPVDGGITLLLAAGGAYGLKRLRERRRQA